MKRRSIMLEENEWEATYDALFTAVAEFNKRPGEVDFFNPKIAAMLGVFHKVQNLLTELRESGDD